MIIPIDIPDYMPERGLALHWMSGFEIMVTENGAVQITANKEGLLSLANHLVSLAQEAVPTGHHFHFDEYNSLEDGSKDLIIVKA